MKTRWMLVGTVLAGALAAGAAPQAQPPARPREAAAPAQAASSRPAEKRAPARFELSVESIMRGPALVGYEPAGLRWSGDSKDLYFEWRKPGEEEASTYRVARAGGEPRRLTDEERRSAPPAAGTWDREHRRVLFAEAGDIAVVDTVARTRLQVTRTAGAEGSPRWAASEDAVTFVRDGSLYLVTLGRGAIEQLLEAKPKAREAPQSPSQRLVESTERELFEHTRRAAERKKTAEEKARREAPPIFETEEGQSVADLALSPDGTHVFVLVSERPAGARNADAPAYVTESGYAQMVPGRSNVGDAQPRRRLAVFDLRSRTRVWADQAFAGREPARAGTTTGGATASGGKPDVARAVSWSMPVFSADGALAVAWVRSADFKDRWIVAVDAATGACRVVDALHDDAWVHEGAGGPGRSAGAGFLPDGRRLYFTSERTGWMHLYVVDAAQPGAQPRALTSGAFEVSGVSLSFDRRRFYFTSNERHPGERHLYSVPVEGGTWTPLTSMPGANLGEVSPDGSTIGLVHSYSNTPPEVFLAPAGGGAARQVTVTPTGEWRSFAWADPRVLTYAARDGARVHARLFTPEMVGARRHRRRPGVVFVHGAGYLQNAHRYWSSYFREYMFHNLLASRGYVVLDVDYRASAGYGRDWRTAIYRHMGGKDLDDVVDAAKYLASAEKVDPARIGVYGGSYGGFITLMAMFTSPGTFAAGAALRPVTDWSHYNHAYTGAILNLPQDDREAYRRSSPIFFAEGLRGALLICHGVVDTNVHFQDSVRLAQRLIELRKENWELAAYPVENHGFEDEASWEDEYRRILRLFETNLAR